MRNLFRSILARKNGVSLGILWSGWGDELPLHEASLELDPPEAERIDRAALQLAKSIKGERADFNGTEHEAAIQSTEEADEAAKKLSVMWPKSGA